MGERIRLSQEKPGARVNHKTVGLNKTKSQSNQSLVDRILNLQRTIGNQAVTRLIQTGAIQASLKIGQPGDIYEKEADRVAEEVMRMPDQAIQRQAEEEEEEKIQTKPLAEQITPLVQRQAVPEEEEEPVQAKLRKDSLLQRQVEEEEEEIQAKLVSDSLLQRQGEEEEEKEEEISPKASGNSATVSSDIESRIQSMKSGGQPLSESTRAYFEPRFGTDFSQVRVHTDSSAAETAQAINARAFTTGKDIVFGSGQYSPGTSSGKHLLAHELTHVVQQNNSNIKRSTIKKKPKTGNTSIDALSQGSDIPDEPYVDRINRAPGVPTIQRQPRRLARPTELIQILTGVHPGANWYGFQLMFRCRSTSGDVRDLQNQAPNLIWRERVTYSRNDFAHRFAPPDPTILPPGGVSFAAADTTRQGRNLLEFDGVTDTHRWPSFSVREADFQPLGPRPLPGIVEARQVYQYSPDGGANWRYFAGAFIIRRTLFRDGAGNLRFRTNKVRIHSVTENYIP